MKNKRFTADELYDYLKKNKLDKVLVKTTKDFMWIPLGTILFVCIEGRYLSTYDKDVGELNKKFKYGFDYRWSRDWHEDYGGTFELLESENEENYYAIIVNKELAQRLSFQLLQEKEQFELKEVLRF
jgi:hypothetical protein